MVYLGGELWGFFRSGRLWRYEGKRTAEDDRCGERIKELCGFLDESLLARLPVWRLITEGVATKKEINEEWSLVDIMEALAVLDFKSEVERAISEITMPKAETK